jgi:alpha-D-xyloside xylohydrolase
MSPRARSYFVAALLALALTGISAPLSGAPTPVVSADQEADGVTFHLAGAILKLQVFSERTVRVECAPGSALPDLKSLSVVGAPTPTHWTFRETPSGYILATDALQVRVDRKTAAVTFFDSNSKVCLAEVAGGGKTFQVRQEFALSPDEAIFGLGQPKDGTWNYRGDKVLLEQANMRIAIPFLVSSRGYGLFWDNPAIGEVTVGAPGKKATLAWSSEAGYAINYYFIYGPELDEVIGGYRELTGSAPLMGKWFYGFWQCRERYRTQQEVLDIAARYRARGTPFDGIIQDWQYWSPNTWGSHAFDPIRYPDPAAMVAQLHQENVHIIISVWPKFDLGTDHFKQLDAIHGFFDPVIPYVYPKGQGKWYDPFNPAARALYWRQISDSLFKLGIDGWWLDASEPELSGNWGEIRDLSTAGGPGALVANAYPLMTTTAVYQGQRGDTSAKRVFILTRSAYAGQQRNAAVSWSGDIRGDWATFGKQIPDGLNFALSGIPYWNTDIGGFFGGKAADPKFRELFTRWFQFGAFCPLFRVHGTNGPREMWRFDPATDAVLVKYDQLRYRLLPYIYSTAWEVTSAGGTIMRPLVMDFRTDARAVAVSDQYLFGRALLVNPVTTPGAVKRDVYLPAGWDWYDFWTGARVRGGKTISAAAPIATLPLYVKAGSIVPLGPVVNYAMEKPAAPLELRVYRGHNGMFNLYEDAGDSYAYEKGEYSIIPMAWDEGTGQLTIGARRGSFPGMVADREFRIVWVRDGRGVGLPEETSPDVNISYHGDAVVVPAVAAMKLAGG